MAAPTTMEIELAVVQLDGEWVIANPSRPLTEDEAKLVLAKYLVATQALCEIGIDIDGLAKGAL